MRGLKLFVRPAEAADDLAVRTFLCTYQHHFRPSDVSSPLSLPPSLGSSRTTTETSYLVGKLLGDLVAVVSFHLAQNALRVDCIVVAEALRRKRIGRVMMRETEQLAAKLDQPQVIVDDAGAAAEFFRRVGFTSEGERWVKSVTLQSS